MQPEVIVPEVIVYATPACPYCHRAQKLLERKGVNYTLVDVSGQPEKWAEMEERSGRSTVPQIFIGRVHVGGCDDLHALDAQGRLDELLTGSEQTHE